MGETPPRPFENFDSFSQEFFEKFIKATKYANDLPEEEEFKYYSTSYKPFKHKMKELSKRLLNLTQQFIDHEEPEENPKLNELDDVEDVIDRFASVVDIVDGMIERVDNFADQATSDNKTNFVISKATNTNNQNKSDYFMFYGSNILRPQLKFEDKPDNSPAPFIPKIKAKPNALKSLDLKLETGTDPTLQVTKDMELNLLAMGIKPNELQEPECKSYVHPYEYEINNLDFRDFQLQPAHDVPFKPLTQVAWSWVDTPEKLQCVADKLDSVTEFALDLEHHSYRTYQGFVCLMQISTRTEDFLIDTLILRSHLHILNSSFTNPNIVKVLHGGDSDIIWLQRDFGLYIVNMFDTGQAARVLEFPSFALAHLLKTYCGIIADKKYQLADWRIRPLPEEMINYAREDTHYLLFIYDKLKNLLIAQGNQNNNLLLSVLNRSKAVTLRKYEKERTTNLSYLNLYFKHNLSFNAIQMKVFKTLFYWRDRVARDEDESTRYVLPNHMLFYISQLMPSTTEELFSCCGTIPPLLRLYADDIVAIINKTKLEPIAPPEFTVTLNPPSTPTHKHFLDVDDKKQPIGMITPPTTTSKNGSSPVLSADQLYSIAGWVDKFDSVNDEKAAHLKTIFSNEPSKTSLNSSLFLDGDSDDDDEDAEAKATVAKIFSSIQNPFSFAFDHIKDIQDAPKSTLPDQDETTVDNKLSSVDDEKDISVPHSMAEIYQLSNRNKKRNKDKKKLKEESISQASSSLDDGNDSDEESNLKRQKPIDQKSRKDTDEFMKTIGWVESGSSSLSSSSSSVGSSSMLPISAPNSVLSNISSLNTLTSPPTQTSLLAAPSSPSVASNKPHPSQQAAPGSKLPPQPFAPFDYSAAQNPFANKVVNSSKPGTAPGSFNPYATVQIPSYNKPKRNTATHYNQKAGPRGHFGKDSK